jgi:hypothetical protein
MSYDRELVKSILTHPRDFSWSVQGLGMLRTYISDELRLHVWDSRLRVPNVSDLHTHPWDLHSTVVAGVYEQRRYEYDDALTAEVFNRARIKCGENACVIGQDKVLLVPSPRESYEAGHTYFQHRAEIHQSFPLNGTVTLVQRFFKQDRDHADVFWQGDGGWVDAAPRAASRNEVLDVTHYALIRWFGGGSH